ncbi:MAG: carboxypeptidase-like regulatory domain-containing protein [Planctomycetota bacterium]|nr:carboxypeptidase-like regulatory domain-containing protein [Planctomycetota bacterium]
MTKARRRRDMIAAAMMVMLAACEGDGSDIGPRLPLLPAESTKVMVFDDGNRGVVSATVSVVGSSTSALTGRNGRGDFLAEPRGRVLFDVDPTWAAATAGDALAGYRVALSVVGTDLPVPLHVPDVSAAASASIAVGEQQVQTVVASANGELTVPAGTTVSIAGAGSTARVGLGELLPEHLPGDLPVASVGAFLFGRGFYVGPADASYSPGIDLDVDAADLKVTTPGAQLFWLDSETGEWAPQQVPVSASGGRLSVAGAITRGGLYAFGVNVATARTVQGRVVDVEGEPVFNAIVKVDHRSARSAGDGRFIVDGVPATFGDGAPRDAWLEIYAGPTWLPEVVTDVAPYSSQLSDLGDVVLDTVRAGNVRVQQVVRARADPFQPARLSSVREGVALHYTSDENGQALFEDVPAEFFGYQEGRRRDRRDSFYGQQVGFLGRGQRWLDSYQFLFDRRWFQGTRSARGYICDRIGGGPVEFAHLVRGEQPSEGYVGETRENGNLFADREFEKRATAVLRTARDGVSITHAFTIEYPSSDHLEFPMRRVLRQPLGAFERHAYVTGSVAGTDPALLYETRVTRRLTRQDLWNDVFEGAPPLDAYPVDAGVSAIDPAFRVGLPVAGGNVAVAELEDQGASGFALRRAAVLAGVRSGLVEGSELALPAPAPLEAAATFRLTDALSGAPSEVDPANLSMSLGQVVDGAGVVDVARDVDASITQAGADLELALTALPAGAQWLVMVGGESEANGVTSSHASMVEVADAATAGFSFQPFPSLASPAPGATVPAAGFEVEFSMPPSAIGGMLELRSVDQGDDLLIWEVLVRSDWPDFRFVTLPIEAAADTPLIAGRTYQLTVTAWFGEFDIDSPDPFGEFAAYAQSIAPIEAGVRQVTRRSVEITTN